MAAKVANLFQAQAGTVHWLNACVKRGEKETFSEVITLTPGLAGELLRRNPDNRRIRDTKVIQYAADMKAGAWKFNGEPFIISRDGLLNDGQHRANAVVEANTMIEALFVFGIDRDSRLTIDQGAARGAADYLSMEGRQNAACQASMARIIIAYERSGGESLSGANYVTNQEVRARVASDSKIEQSAHFAMAHNKAAKPFAPVSVIGFCHYVCSDICPVEAGTYLTQVCEGEGLRKKDPALTVRERLLTVGKSRDAKIHVILRGWNAFRGGRTLNIVKIIGGAASMPALI